MWMDGITVAEQNTVSTMYYGKAVRRLKPTCIWGKWFLSLLQTQIDTLQVQLDQLESELETMECTSKKKKMDKESVRF